jgi:hypothetical protein
MSDFNVYGRLREFEQAVYQDFLTDFRQMLKDGDEVDDARETIQDRIWEYAEPDFVIYTGKAFLVAAHMFGNADVEELFDDVRPRAIKDKAYAHFYDKTSDPTLAELVTSYASCVAYKICQQALTDAYEQICSELDVENDPESDDSEEE